VTGARSCQGADRAARALLLLQPGRSHDLWWMWGVIVPRALLEAAAARATDGGRRRRESATLLEDWAAAILDGDVAWPRAALRQATNTGAESIATLVADANGWLDRFEQSVIIRLGDRCVQSVGVTVVLAIGMWRRPPPAITCGEWIAPPAGVPWTWRNVTRRTCTDLSPTSVRRRVGHRVAGLAIAGAATGALVRRCRKWCSTTKALPSVSAHRSAL
jgi:hypothetical protein